MATSITGQGIAAYKAPDNALSSESKNAVQNKVIDEELSDVKNVVSQLLDSNDESISEETVGFIKNNGTLDGNTAWHCLYTEKIACKPGWKYHYLGGTYNAIAQSVLFFNGSSPVSQEQYNTGSDVEVTIPSGVDSVIFQSATVPYAPVSLAVKRIRPESILDLQDDLIAVNETVADIDDIVRASIALSDDTVGYIQNNGVLKYDTGWHCLHTEKLPCEPGWAFKYKGWTYSGMANCVLFFNGDTPVSQLRYNAGSDAVDIVVPDDVDGVIFQTASIPSVTLSLTVSRLLPLPLENAVPELERMDAEIQQLSHDLSSNAFYSKYNTAEIFDDLSKYSKADTSSGRVCPNPIPAYTWIDEVDFLSAGGNDGYIIIADSNLYASYLRFRIVAMYPVTTVEGWNTVKINFNTCDCDSYLIGFSNIGISYGDYSTLPSSTDSKYRFSTVSAVNAYTLQAAPTIGAWISEQHSHSVYFMCYPFTVVAYTGIIPTASGKADSADNYVQSKRAIYTGALLPKYKVIDGKEYGFVGRWYSYTYDGNPVMVASAAGAEVCFKVSSVDSITINWTGDNVSDDVYYCYEIDGTAKVRTNITDNTISLPNTDEHIIRIVCDSIPHNGTTNCWTPGYGWVFAGVTTSGGTLKGIVPTNKTIMYFGDSLTEGVRALGVESGEEVEADVDSATESYGWFASKYLQCTPIIVGYGSTGILANGYFRKCIDAINYLANGIETPDVSPDLIVINHGHNDAGWSDENWINEFNSVLDRIQVKYPGVQVVGLSPFNHVHAGNMKACCEARSWCHYIDTTAWALDRFYVDGPGHLTAAGADVCGTLLAKEIKRLDLI